MIGLELQQLLWARKQLRKWWCCNETEGTERRKLIPVDIVKLTWGLWPTYLSLERKENSYFKPLLFQFSVTCYPTNTESFRLCFPISITCIFCNKNVLFQYYFQILKKSQKVLMSQVVGPLINISKLPILTTVSTDPSGEKKRRPREITVLAHKSTMWACPGNEKDRLESNQVHKLPRRISGQIRFKGLLR